MVSAASLLHLYLLLGDRVLGLREGRGADEESRELTNRENSVSEEPPKWSKGGCASQKGNRCKWLLCKHHEYKTRLMREKYDFEVQEKSLDSRSTAEEQRQRIVEDKFLLKSGVDRRLHKAIGYAMAGEIEKCTWAEDELTMFEEWLKILLPQRYDCVQRVVDKHGRTEQICIEGYTQKFKGALRESCQDRKFPDQVSEREAESKLRSLKRFFTVNKYKLAHRAAIGTTVVGGTAAVIFSGLTMVSIIPFLTMLIPGFMSALTIPGAILAALISIGLVVPALVYIICRSGAKSRKEGYYQAKYNKRISRE